MHAKTGIIAAAMVTFVGCVAEPVSPWQEVDAGADADASPDVTIASAAGGRYAVVIRSVGRMRWTHLRLEVSEGQWVEVDPRSVRLTGADDTIARALLDGVPLPQNQLVFVQEAIIAEFEGSPVIGPGMTVDVGVITDFKYSVSLVHDLSCAVANTCGEVVLGTATAPELFEVPGDMPAFPDRKLPSNALACNDAIDCVGWRPADMSADVCVEYRCHDGFCSAAQLSVGSLCRAEGCARGICQESGCVVDTDCSDSCSACERDVCSVVNDSCCNSNTPCPKNAESCLFDTCNLETQQCETVPVPSCCQSEGDCGQGEVCREGFCRPEGDPASWGFPLPGTLLTSFEVAGSSDCCFDIDGDGDVDNFIGGFNAGIGSLTGGAASVFMDAGPVALGFRGLGDGGPVDVVMGLVTDADGDPGNDLSGEGTFALTSGAFFTGTATPVHGFTAASFAEGQLVASEGRLQLPWSHAEVCGDSLDFSLGLLLPLDMPWGQAMLSANATVAPNGGLTMTDGKLTGVAPMGYIVDRLNALFAARCGCVDGSVSFSLDSDNKIACDDPGVDASACSNGLDYCENESPDFVCKLLTDDCSIVRPMFSPDVDTDFDGVADSLSISATFEGVSAIITLAP